MGWLGAESFFPDYGENLHFPHRDCCHQTDAAEYLQFSNVLVLPLTCKDV